MSRLIEVVPYDPDWPEIFEATSKLITQALGQNCIAIHHVGSTAVPGLMAKAKIDIIAVVKDTALVAQALKPLGYQYKGEYNIPFRLFFAKRRTSPEINLHVFENGNPEIELNILFRDFLRQSPQALKEYGDLKVRLLSTESAHERGAAMFSGYNLGKDAFIRKILEQAGFQGLCVRLSIHYEEWGAYHRIRKEQIFDHTSVVYDPNHPTLTLANHHHLILYKGTTIVSVVHVEMLSAQETAIRSLATDNPYKGNGYRSYLLTMVEKWLKRQGTEIIKTHASLRAEGFYRSLGYQNMPFDDPSICADTINLGKKLA